MKKRCKCALAVVLCLSMITASACGEKGNDGKNNVAMGRYVETMLDFPVEDAYVLKMAKLPDRSLDVYFFHPETKALSCYNTSDGKKWKEKVLPWKMPREEGGLYFDQEGRPYIVESTYDGIMSAKLYRVEEDGSLAEIPVQWPENDKTKKFGHMVENMTFIDNGNFVISLMGAGVVQFDSSGKLVHSYGGEDIGVRRDIASAENLLYILDNGTGNLETYDAASFEQLNRVPFENFTDMTNIAAGENETVFLYNQNGVYRLPARGSIFEKIIDGELTSLSIPSYYLSNFVEGENETFYLLGSGENEKSQLVRYKYDKNVAATPEKELVVYALTENSNLRRAAGLYQRKHPDTRVNIQVADSTSTVTDQIKKLNTQLLEGAGPDVLLLDGLPVSSYIEKGILEDLSGVLKKEKDQLLEPVMDTYRVDESVYAVPTRFILPVLFTKSQYAEDFKNLHSAAEFAAAHPEIGLVGDRSAERLIRLFLPVCAPAWFDGKTIKEAGVKEFLTELKKISDVGAASYPADPSDFSKQGTVSMNGGGVGAVSMDSGDKVRDDLDLFHWAFGRAHTYISKASGFSDMIKFAMGSEKLGSGSAVLLPGQSENVFIPTGVMGINAKGKQLDDAKDFIASMLSAGQQKSDLKNGLPVNVKALEELASAEPEGYYLSISNSDENQVGEELEGGAASVKDKTLLLDLCKKVQTPYRADETFTKMFVEEAAGYLENGKTLDQTVADIKEKTKLYLSE